MRVEKMSASLKDRELCSLEDRSNGLEARGKTSRPEGPLLKSRLGVTLLKAALLPLLEAFGRSSR